MDRGNVMANNLSISPPVVKILPILSFDPVGLQVQTIVETMVHFSSPVDHHIISFNFH